MDGIMRRIHDTCSYKRLAYIAIASVFILCSSPLGGRYIDSNNTFESQKFASEVLAQVEAQDPDTLMGQFDDLDHVFETSQNPLAEGHQFLQAFIGELNDKYNLNLTIADACRLVQENLHTLNLSEEHKKIILATIQIYESNSMPIQLQGERKGAEPRISSSLCWPWDWNWFGLNKDKKHSQSKCLARSGHHAKSPTLMDKELPGNCYLGGCELLTGVLISLLPIPGSLWLGGVIIGDGARRVIDGVVQLSDERRSSPNYTPPPSPSGFNF